MRVVISDERAAHLETVVEEGLGNPSWLSVNYTEPRVNYALQDLVKAGSVAYDVGANFGGISLTLSRLTGPRGIVCSFEANPVIAAKCQRAFTRSGSSNCHLYQAAIYRESGKDVTLYLSDNEVADSIYRKTDRSIVVKTISLDDFSMRFKFTPDIVKMDIEGAEYDALCGFEKTLDFCKPTLILEHTPPDTGCMEFLFSKGYSAIDLQNYRRIKSPADILSDTIVTDVLYATPERLLGTPYAGELELGEEFVLTSEDFQWTDEMHLRSKSVDLPPGRYVGTLEFSATGESNTMLGIRHDTYIDAIMRVHASSSALVGFARNIVFDTGGGNVHVFFDFLDSADSSLKIEAVSIRRVNSFNDGLRLHGLFSYP